MHQIYVVSYIHTNTAYDIGPYLVDLETNMIPENVSTSFDVESEPMDMFPTISNVFQWD